MPSLEIENSLKGSVAGVDEAGRGPWAGPVVAAAVILNHKRLPAHINDSKKVTAVMRLKLYSAIIKTAQIGIGKAEVEEIDQYNILEATKMAMQRAVRALPIMPNHVLVDGNHLPEFPCAAMAIVKGDSRCLSIAAASIIAKVTRDKIMLNLHQQYPQFGWQSNAGYGTKEHHEALRKFGITPHHRKSFSPVRALLMSYAVEA